jgi:hypothetical protein
MLSPSYRDKHSKSQQFIDLIGMAWKNLENDCGVYKSSIWGWLKCQLSVGSLGTGRIILMNHLECNILG